LPIYSLIIKSEVQSEVNKIRGQDRQRILAAFDDLREEPRPRGMQKVSGNYQPPLWRIRVGDFRIIYRIDDDEAIIAIEMVSRRNERTYRRLS